MPFYIKILNKRFYALSILHFIMGIIISSRKDLATIWGLAIFFYGFLYIIRYGNRNDEASFFASYLVGIEVALRAVGASLLWEYGKYSTIFLLVTGMVVENIKFLRLNTLSVVYIASLLPSIAILPEVKTRYIRMMVSGNLSGPLCLFISFIYFRQRKFKEENILNVFKCLSLPIITLIGLIFVRAPSIEDISFSSEANFQLSAGFGPNQVSTLLGLPLVIISILKICNLKFYPKPIFDYAFVSISLGLALLTFARGGVIAPVFTITFLYFISGRLKRHRINYKTVFYLVLLLGGLYYFSSNFTAGMLDQRYLNLATIANQGDGTVSGRAKIMVLDFEIFKDNFLMGVGPGGGHHQRLVYGYGSAVASHSEFTRMLAEHGLFGLISLISILLLFYIEYKKRVDYNRIFLAGMSLFAILTMFHSAFRIALPGFVYGLSYVILTFRRR